MAAVAHLTTNSAYNKNEHYNFDFFFSLTALGQRVFRVVMLKKKKAKCV